MTHKNETHNTNSNVRFHFRSTFTNLIWQLFDPGKQDDFIPDDKMFAHIMNFIYQVFAVLILLNLLIAIMNATGDEF